MDAFIIALTFHDSVLKRWGKDAAFVSTIFPIILMGCVFLTYPFSQFFQGSLAYSWLAGLIAGIVFTEYVVLKEGKPLFLFHQRLTFANA